MKTIGKHLRDFLIPIFVTILLPWWINYLEYQWFNRPLCTNGAFQLAAGIVIGLAGLALLITSMVLMIRIAKSTVMPWDPSQNLVVRGPYRHLRNPMILGVIILLIGEALILSSVGVAILAVAFFFLNTLYFILFEEPKLEAQFGEAYQQYKANVPRWLPRLKPWHPGEDTHDSQSQ
ncbi:MAG: isoprenylcysteine carboxylmethyltransferase family protein [Brevefilum sp.]|nr:isoprenylcysteine carboxylmethyltransferase family protein [Brevefilum sp.]